MVDLGTASENDVVLAFLRAEIDAPRFRDGHIQYLQSLGRSRTSLIDRADLANECDNHMRAISLALTRGYGRNALLFRGYPNDIVWRRFETDVTELGQFLYANFPVLSEVAGTSRLVCEGARRVQAALPGLSMEAQRFVKGVPIVVENAKAAHSFPELVAVRDSQSENIVLLEGHTRATAFVIAQKLSPTRVLIGSSPRMHEWWLI